MSESMDERTASVGAVAASPTAGAMLKAAREASGLHIAALAVSMKVPVKKLEALEADRLDLLPDPVFVRALAGSMCRSLKIDAAPILQKLPQSVTPRLDTEVRGINTPFHVPGESGGLSLPGFLSHPTARIVLVLLVAMAAILLWPPARNTSAPSVQPATDAVADATSKPADPAPLFPPKVEGGESMPAAVVASAPAPAVVASVATTPVAVAVPVVPVVQASSVAVAPVAARASAAAVPVPAASVLATAVPPKASREALASSAAQAAAVVDGPVVSFKVKAGSWVEVTDAKGVVQLRRTVFPGEVVTSTGTPPLTVVVGKVDMTTVEVRGKPFPLDAFARDNVARFEVK